MQQGRKWKGWLYGTITIDRCGNTGRVFQRCHNDRIPSGIHDDSPAASDGLWYIQSSEFFEYKTLVPDEVRKGERYYEWNWFID